MKIADIKNPVSSLPGAGPATVAHLSNLNIFTVGDLLQFYPRSYEDRTKRIPLKDFSAAKKIHTAAKVIAHEHFGYGKMKTLKIIIQDETAKAALIAFNRPFLEQTLPVNSILCVSGIFEVKYNELQSTRFEATVLKPDGALEEFQNAVLPDSGIIPVYKLTQGLSQKTIAKLISRAISQYAIGIDDELPQELIKKRALLSKKNAVKKIHQPQNMNDAEDARRTLIYEELFLFQSTLLERAFLHTGTFPDADFSAVSNTAQTANLNSKLEKTDYSPSQVKLLESLPFSLTPDQISVINQMNREIDRGYKERNALLQRLENRPKENPAHETIRPFTMQRLLQGDVGSGKTLVALFAALRVADWGGQTAFMAPTEILARQHAENINRLTENLGIRVAFLTGNVKTAGRKTLLKALKTGNVHILVGTHALFSNNVAYKDLQLAVIDEQHRFGVLQRQAIIEKGKQLFNSVYASPHVLMMSATPIPQTLALTVFGDLDVSTIRTLPQGRKPVKTYLVSSGHEQNAYNAVRQELEKGHQAYFVYPAIETPDGDFENAELNAPGFSNSENIKSAEAAFKELSSSYFSKYHCALIHSKIPEEQQTRILDDFRYGKIQMLFATTVVEVGVDVPNATCIVIEQADRFGLSQLHQLRGRVGRGDAPGFCFLIYRKNISENGIQRMKILWESTDGFFIAEEDLKLRGPGEITGTVQSGDMKLGIADFSRDSALLLEARKDALSFLKAAHKTT